MQSSKRRVRKKPAKMTFTKFANTRGVASHPPSANRANRVYFDSGIPRTTKAKFGASVGTEAQGGNMQQGSLRNTPIKKSLRMRTLRYNMPNKFSQPQ
jgi:hypothetical protein